MRTLSHTSVAAAEVRGYPLRRHAGTRLEGGRAFAVVSGIGRPRTWQYASTHALRGFRDGIEKAQGHGRGDERLHAAYRSARSELASACNMLIEREPPDAALLGLLVDQGILHVLVAGPGRAYLHRRGTPKRLTRGTDSGPGMLRTQAAQSSVALDSGDLILAGSISAFSARAVEQAAEILNADPEVPPPVLASVLTEPAAEAGVGAIALVIRAI